MSSIFRRILVAVVVGLVLMFARQAFALVPRVSGYSVQSGPIKATPAEACAAYGAIFTASAGVTLQSTSINGDGRCVINYRNAGGDMQTVLIVDHITSGLCPANSSPVGTETCSCNAPYEENSTATACVMPKSEWEKKCNAVAGTSAGPGDWAGNMSSTGCAPVPGGGQATQGCMVTGADLALKYQVNGGWITSNANTTYTGGTCVPNVDAPSTVKDDCPNGVSGMVNGKKRCVAVDPTVPATEGSRTETVNPDGSTTVTESQTSCIGAKCTTTTTSTTTGGAGGGGTSTTSTTEGIGDYCKKNPQTNLCRTTGQGTGATSETDAEDKSDGDCDDKSSIIGCMKPGSPPADQQIPKKELVYGLGGVPVSGFSAACPSPTSFVVFGKSFAISYEPLCDSAGWIKPLILLVAGLASALIVYRSMGGS